MHPTPQMQVILCSSSIWHMNLRTAFDAFAKKLSPQGVVLFNFGEAFFEFSPAPLPAGNRRYLVELLRAGYALGMRAPKRGTVRPRERLTPDRLASLADESGLRIVEEVWITQTVGMAESRAWMSIPAYAHQLPGLSPDQSQEAVEIALSRMADDDVFCIRWVLFALSFGHR